MYLIYNDKMYLAGLRPLIVFLFLTLFAPLIFCTGVEAGIMLHPTRIFLDNRNNSGTVMVINQENVPVKYRVSTTLYRTKPNGALEEILDLTQEQQELKRMLRFSPRQATLGPREKQTIRLQFRKIPDFSDGEYRVHLKVSPLPEDDSNARKADNTKLGVQINLLVGFSIPIVIRNGNLWVEAEPVACERTVSKLTGKPVLSVGVLQKGTRSAVVNITAYHILEKNSEAKVLLGKVPGAVVYPDVSLKTFDVPLDETLLDRIDKGFIRIELSDSEEKNTREGKNNVQYKSREF
ncbi:hypothetical protein [uncultured Desulfobacter sp.]|uniref:fimbrial biogenesis chaperone n=1 Tax=uncultured Desulfobacter sp. TaxID=240139 RepID=UPI002AAC328F|nr:hypothetical protein [uncultured Desulfobacter sp.]